MKNITEVEFTVSGDVQGVGYRNFVTKAARKLSLEGHAENMDDGTVKILCRGATDALSRFKSLINVKNPKEAPLIDVESIKEKELAQGTVKDTGFREKYNDHVSEMAQGFSTGMNYMNLFRNETTGKFDHMDKKYDKISMAMLEIAGNMTKRDDIFESKFIAIEQSVEKTNKNIENLLQILARNAQK